MAIEKVYLTTKELADYLGISEATLLLHRVMNTGPAYVKIGRLVRYRRQDVEDWIQQETEKNKKS